MEIAPATNSLVIDRKIIPLRSIDATHNMLAQVIATFVIKAEPFVVFLFS